MKDQKTQVVQVVSKFPMKILAETPKIF